MEVSQYRQGTTRHDTEKGLRESAVPGRKKTKQVATGKGGLFCTFGLLMCDIFITFVVANQEKAMSGTLQLIRAILVELIDRIDNGRCSTTEEQNEKFLQCLRSFDTERKYNKTEAIRYLGVSRSKFDELRRQGKLSNGKKKVGDVSREWTKEELDRYINHN